MSQSSALLELRKNTAKNMGKIAAFTLDTPVSLCKTQDEYIQEDYSRRNVSHFEKRKCLDNALYKAIALLVEEKGSIKEHQDYIFSLATEGALLTGAIVEAYQAKEKLFLLGDEKQTESDVSTKVIGWIRKEFSVDENNALNEMVKIFLNYVNASMSKSSIQWWRERIVTLLEVGANPHYLLEKGESALTKILKEKSCDSDTFDMTQQLITHYLRLFPDLQPPRNADEKTVERGADRKPSTPGENQDSLVTLLLGSSFFRELFLPRQVRENVLTVCLPILSLAKPEVVFRKIMAHFIERSCVPLTESPLYDWLDKNNRAMHSHEMMDLLAESAVKKQDKELMDNLCLRDWNAYGVLKYEGSDRNWTAKNRHLFTPVVANTFLRRMTYILDYFKCTFSLDTALQKQTLPKELHGFYELLVKLNESNSHDTHLEEHAVFRYQQLVLYADERVKKNTAGSSTSQSYAILSSIANQDKNSSIMKYVATRMKQAYADSQQTAFLMGLFNRNYGASSPLRKSFAGSSIFDRNLVFSIWEFMDGKERPRQQVSQSVWKRLNEMARLRSDPSVSQGDAGDSKPSALTIKK